MVWKNKFALNLLIFIILTLLMSSCSSSGGGGSSSPAGITGANAVPVSFNVRFMQAAGPEISSFPPDASGNVYITVMHGALGTSERSAGSTLRVDFKARTATLAMYSNDTYEIIITARIKNTPGDTVENVFTATKTIFVPDPVSDNVIAPASEMRVPIDLKFSNYVYLRESGVSIDEKISGVVISGESLPDFSIKVLDQRSEIFAGFDGTCEIYLETIEASLGNASLSGQIVKKPINGIAEFSGISVTGSGKYRLYIRTGSLITSIRDIIIKKDRMEGTPVKLVFDPAPPEMVAAGTKWPVVGVKALDKFGAPVAITSEVTISAMEGSIKGVLSTRPDNGVIKFDSVTSENAGKITLTASIPGVSGSAGLSVTAGTTLVVSGDVARTAMIVSVGAFVYCYDIYHAGSSGGMKFTAKMRWSVMVDASEIRSMKINSTKDKLYVLAKNNAFFTLSNLDGKNPSMKKMSWGWDGEFVNFSPSLDGLKIFLITKVLLIKWHMINEPNFLSAFGTISLSAAMDVVETDTNRLLVIADKGIYSANFDSPVPEMKFLKYMQYSKCIDYSYDRGILFVAASADPVIISLDIKTGQFSEHRIGDKDRSLSSQEFIKYLNRDGVEKLYRVGNADDRIFSYDMGNKTEKTIWLNEDAKITPGGLAASSDRRLLFIANASRPSFLKVIDTSNDSVAGDLYLNDNNGYTFFQNISGILSY